jgi:hypothetical protein
MFMQISYICSQLQHSSCHTDSLTYFRWLRDAFADKTLDLWPEDPAQCRRDIVSSMHIDTQEKLLQTYKDFWPIDMLRKDWNIGQVGLDHKAVQALIDQAKWRRKAFFLSVPMWISKLRNPQAHGTGSFLTPPSLSWSNAANLSRHIVHSIPLLYISNFDNYCSTNCDKLEAVYNESKGFFQFEDSYVSPALMLNNIAFEKTTSRSQLIQEIFLFAFDASPQSKFRCALLQGPRGSGKTASLAKFCQQVSDRIYSGQLKDTILLKFAFIRFNRYNTMESFVLSLCIQFWRYFSQYFFKKFTEIQRALHLMYDSFFSRFWIFLILSFLQIKHHRWLL